MASYIADEESVTQRVTLLEIENRQQQAQIESLLARIKRLEHQQPQPQQKPKRRFLEKGKARPKHGESGS